MATSRPYTEQRQSTLPSRVNISSQIPTPSHQDIPRNIIPIVKIRANDYNLWFDGKPRNPLPPFSSSYQPYIPAQMAPRPPLKCAYCKEEGHSATRCTHLAEDLDKRIVRTQGASYLFPNYQRVPMEGNESVKEIVRAFAKEQPELNKKFMEKPTVKPKPEEDIKPTEKKPEDKSTSIAHVEVWSNWKPPTISSANDPFESHIGLRQKKQIMERQSQNQEQKKKAAIPGTYIEEEKEEERVIIPTKF
ncbi:hypothetical protein O181_073709 [Austropuccinia psidii MF-1]|uniref:CCHC-type domain-containing protein n=1 Tax=Austropuccinia psidii MF-1 TaxID=1389203 RepID=A0A9Q3ICR1_9BASI|nr:hypothetical protein [Austropuccinia psidii MF-1]